MSDVLLVPDHKSGGFKERGIAKAEETPILSFEHDSGTIKLDVIKLCLMQKRLMRDLIIQTDNGMVCGVLILTDPMGPGKIAELEARGLIPKG